MKQAKEGRRGRRKKLLTTNICFVTGIYKWFSMVNTRRQTKFLFPWTNGSTMGLIGKRVRSFPSKFGGAVDGAQRRG